MIEVVNIFKILTGIKISFRSEKSFNMAGLAFMFVIVFNCMLCARCQLRNSNGGLTPKETNSVEHPLISGNISTHKQLGGTSPNIRETNYNSIIDDLALLQTIVQNTGKDVNH